MYLEDSYVLDIVEQSGEVRFSLEAVLTPKNPKYHDPLPGEQYCYARAELVFREVSSTEWISRSFKKYTDADGEEDLGNIDVLRNSDDIYTVEGDWGKVRIRSVQAPEFNLAVN